MAVPEAESEEGRLFSQAKCFALSEIQFRDGFDTLMT